MKKILMFLCFLFVFTSLVFASDFDGYIVKIKENTASALSAELYSGDAELFSELEDEEVVGILASELDDTSEIVNEHLLVKAENEESLNNLIDLGVVETYEKDYLMELFDYDVSKNANYSTQRWYLDYINSDFAFNAGIHGDGAKVAVIDSGIYPHKDIKANIQPGKNYYIPENIEDYDESDTIDTVSHGTHVAGIISSLCNDIATVGISFNSTVIPMKTTTSAGKVSTSAVISAIYDAYTYYNCDVINMSFGSPSRSTLLENEINIAVDKGLIVVAATGNYGAASPGDGYDVNTPMYPAYFENVIGVANAERYNGSLRIKSSSGYNDRVDIAAPGTDILVITNTDEGVKNVSGTSFSAPMVSAAAALVKSIKPSIGQSEFANLLKQSADSSYIETSGQSTEKWGAGLLDIEALIKLVLKDETYYVSDIHTVNNESYVKVTNMTSSPLEDCRVIITGTDVASGEEKTEKVSVSLSDSVFKKVSLTELGFSHDSVVRKYIPGDINDDGKINILDVSAIIRYLAGYDVKLVEEALDVNGDGHINILDASTILRYCAGYEVVLH